MRFEEISEYKRDLKYLQKKYTSLNEDIETLKKVLNILPDERLPFSFAVNNLGIETCIIKVKKIACRSLKGKGSNTGLRLIYAYFEAEERIVLIELYHKNDKENEDRQRILNHFS